MLVLTRRIGEEIQIPELGITIRLLKMKGKGATLGVVAPREHRVLRGELIPFEEKQVVEANKPLAKASISRTA